MSPTSMPRSSVASDDAATIAPTADPVREFLGQSILSHMEQLNSDAVKSIPKSLPSQLLEQPPEKSWGDYSFPCFRFAKDFKLSPQALAAKIAELFNASRHPMIEAVEVINAFVNIRVAPKLYVDHSLSKALDGSLFQIPNSSVKPKVMVEYSQPNTHKEFHVGHMRNVSLGASIIRLHRYFGFEVVAVNYLGDEGAHIAKCLWFIERQGGLPREDEIVGDKGAWLGSMYVQAAQVLETLSSDEKKAAETLQSQILNGIEKKSGVWFDLWQKTRQWSLVSFKKSYDWIGAPFDRDFFESEVSEESQQVVEEYLEKGVFKADQGAIGIDLSDAKLGFMLVRKRDGNTLYATKDLVLAKKKFEDFKIDKSIYVVGSEQNYHFKQVFKTLEKMGFKQSSKCFHLSYGMVVLPSGKMSSRLGNTVPFSKLQDELAAEIDRVMTAGDRKFQSEEEKQDVIHRLSRGAIIYGMIGSDASKDIVFDLKNWLSFEGNTGPYLMYAYSRASSLLAKSDLELNDLAVSVPKQILASEKDLLRSIHDFNRTAWTACMELKPNLLAYHLYEMARAFSRFYAEAPILKEADLSCKRFRLQLTKGFAKVMFQGLDVLGMPPPKKM